ncbi:MULTISPECIES: CDP-alcohol phosphatidyltransferase family protein [Cysteiniphilum]|uniref:CDP-alcohol phosphatidyltransferase family protein n=1 Tax=Cysteiniphilum TaxID=2056696 RepID=UPI00177AA144|nr:MULTISPECIES: CDP-alcohol phosphatidyltransferase family protein [Cysteiniphilum]
MIESSLRPLFQRIFIQPLMHIGARHLPANAITITSLITGFISACFLSAEFNFMAILWLLISGYLDILDGSVARLQNNSTHFGTVLDILSDRLVESFIVIALFIRDPTLAFVCLLMMMSMLVCVSSFLLVGIFSEKQSEKSFYYSPGLMERAEAFIFFIAMIIFNQFALIIGIVFTLLVLWTTGVRVYEFYKQSRERK